MPASNPNTDLLNIKEAATFLNVSEASLRRWTNAGTLSCLRIGAKRERRFRQDDLDDFLENRNAVDTTQSAKPQPPLNSEVVLEGVAIEYGTHICTLYENDLGRTKWSVPFLVDGLNGGDCCFLVGTDATRAEIVEQIEESGIDFAKAEADGQFIQTSGVPDGRAMCHFVESSIHKAQRKGFRRFRLLGDMSWCEALGMSKDELFAYEQQFNRDVGHSYPLVSVCQYDTRDFSGSCVLNALKCHEDTFNLPLSRFLAS